MCASDTLQEQIDQADVDRLLISLLQLSPQMEPEVRVVHRVAVYAKVSRLACLQHCSQVFVLELG